MKKILLAGFCSVVSMSLLSQDSDKFHIGVKVSPNLSWIKPDSKHIEKGPGALRFGFGLVMDIHFTDNYAFGTGLNIFHTGGNVGYFQQTFEEGTDQISYLKRTYKMQYGEIPLTLKLRTNEIGYITYWGQFGLGLGVNIRAKADEEIDYRYTWRAGEVPEDNAWRVSDISSRSRKDEDVKDDISLFRTSLIVGAGIEYSVSGKTAILVGVTFNNGFSDVLKNLGLQKDDNDDVIFTGSDPYRTPLTAKLKGINNAIELNLGVMF